MPIELKMPALSPTMEEGTLAKWLVKEGDEVKSGDILAEIETDKATMEFEAVDEGKIAKILVAEGTDGVKVGAPIAILAGEGESTDSARAEPVDAPSLPSAPPVKEENTPSTSPGRTEDVKPAPVETPPAPRTGAPAAPTKSGDRIKASPLARRLAEAQGIDLSNINGSGPGGRIVRADLGDAGRRYRFQAGSGGTRASAAVCYSRTGRHSARAREAFEHAQDHRSAADRVEATGPAHLSHRRRAARCAAENCGRSSMADSRRAG